MTLEEALAAYPFDPRYRDRPDLFQGLEKLRAFEDEGMRRNVFLAMTMPSERRAPREGRERWDQRPRRECLDQAPPDDQDEMERRYGR